MAPYLAVVADDLTGAMDTGLQFFKAGHRTVVWLAAEGNRINSPSDGVVVVTTDSRELEAGASYKAVQDAVGRLRGLGIERFYLKVDSTLRGNVATDLDAMLDLLHFAGAILCPAFPESGRVVVGGYHLVNDVPLERTELAADPSALFRTSFVPEFLSEHSHRSVGLIPLNCVLSGVAAVVGAIRGHLAEDRRIIVADAATRADLSVLARAAEEYPQTLLLAGSAGLAEELAVRMPRGPGERVPAPPPGTAPVAKGPVLLVSGSTTEVTRQQVAQMVAEGFAVSVPVPGAALINGDESAVSRVVAEAHAALADGRNALLISAPEPGSVAESMSAGQARGLSSRETRLAIADGLASVTAALLNSQPAVGLMMTGGEVSRFVLQRLRAYAVEVVGEVQPGVAAGVVRRFGAPPIPVVTKSGSLGGPDALSCAAAYLRQISLEVIAGE